MMTRKHYQAIAQDIGVTLAQVNPGMTPTTPWVGSWPSWSGPSGMTIPASTKLPSSPPSGPRRDSGCRGCVTVCDFDKKLETLHARLEIAKAQQDRAHEARRKSQRREQAADAKVSRIRQAITQAEFGRDTLNREVKAR